MSDSPYLEDEQRRGRELEYMLKQKAAEVMAPYEHQHSYSVVVETKEKPNSEDGYGDVRYMYMGSQKPRAVRATKVMCTTCLDVKVIEL